MIRTLVRAALVAVLVTAGSFIGAETAMADPPHRTGCNANNPGRGCPGNLRKFGPAGSPVCGKGRHVGNPHCRPAAGGTPTRPNPRVRAAGTRVRSATTRTTPRANRAVAPRRGTAVATRAGKAL